MPEFQGTPAADTLDQRVLGLPSGVTIRGLAGDDTIRVFGGQAVGGAGNDVLVRIENGWLNAAYWDSPAGIVANLAEGWVDDGWGTRDTLIDVDSINGSPFDDRMTGSDRTDRWEWFAPNGGRDLILGAGGTDLVWLPGGQSSYTIQVSADLRRVVITSPTDPRMRAELWDIELIQFNPDGVGQQIRPSELITPLSKATQTLPAGDSLRWNAGSSLGAPVSVSYSFMQSMPAYGNGSAGVGFQPLNAAQRDAVRSVLSKIGGQTGITFTETGESPTAWGQIRFGINQQASTTGYAFLPNQPGAGQLAGDVWMDAETMIDLSPGSVGLDRLVHEIGHALGLRHPGNYSASENSPDVLAAFDDGTWQTAMSEHRPTQGQGRVDFGVLDVLALRAIYGVRNVAIGNDVWRLDDAMGSRLGTIVDDGGSDRIDASALSAGAWIDLRDGALSSVGLTAEGQSARENLGLVGRDLIEDVVGSAFDDQLIGNAKDNRLAGGRGNDLIDGQGGSDVAVFDGPRSAWKVSVRPGGRVQVEAADGVSGIDTLTAIETLQFADARLPTTFSREAGVPGVGKSQDFLFDPVFYLLANTSALPSGDVASARTHYFSQGAAQGRAPTAWFDAAYYRNRWSDLGNPALDDATLFRHFNLYGVWEGRSPGPEFDRFDGARYLRDYPDVANYVDSNLGSFLGSRTNGAIAHYILFGAAEQRLAYDQIGDPVDMGYLL